MNNNCPEHQASNFKHYMREVVKTDLLTPDKEVELAGKIKQ
jgi:hypothetical protein